MHDIPRADAHVKPHTRSSVLTNWKPVTDRPGAAVWQGASRGCLGMYLIANGRMQVYISPNVKGKLEKSDALTLS